MPAAVHPPQATRGTELDLQAASPFSFGVSSSSAGPVSGEVDEAIKGRLKDEDWGAGTQVARGLVTGHNLEVSAPGAVHGWHCPRSCWLGVLPVQVAMALVALPRPLWLHSQPRVPQAAVTATAAVGGGQERCSELLGASVSSALVACFVRRSRPRSRGGRRHSSGGHGMRLRAALTETLNVTEVYRLLKQAPTQQHALQLAARLRKAAREGKRTKEGRTLDSATVDEALDVLLENNARLRTPVAKTPKYEEYYDEEEEEDFNPFAQMRQDTVPWAEEAFPEADGREEMLQAAAEEAAQDQADEDGGFHEDKEDDEEGRVHHSFQDAFYKATAGAGEPKEREEREEPSPSPSPAQAQQVPPKWKSGAGEEREERQEEDGDVPYELWEQVISRKFNVVDRVWKAPTSTDLPKVPKLSEDAMVPESAWLRMPHIAVNGMTNCGKSSLINHIVRWNYAAKASSRAGRTTSIDFYVVNNRFVLVDLPGYPDPEEMAHQGVLKRWEAAWEDLVLRYLQMCEEGVYDLRLMMHLQQSHKKPSRACKRFVEELQTRKLPTLLILTKDDHLPKPHLQRNAYATQIKKSLRMEGPHIHYTSRGSLEMGRRSKKHVQKWIKTAVTAESAQDVKNLLQEKWENRIISPPKKTPEELQAKKELWKARYLKLRQEKKAQRRKERAAAVRTQREKKASQGESSELVELDGDARDFARLA